MAAKVKWKFVVLLAAALLMVCAGVIAAYFFITSRSGASYVRRGDAAMARGDINAADSFYDRAVGKDRTNIEWLVKWRDARAKKVPETFSSYQDDYRMYGGILRSIALVQRTNVDAHKDYLQNLYDAGALNYVVEETDTALRFFEPERPPALRRFRGMALARLYAAGVDFPEADKHRIPLAKEDLEAVLQADPTDADAVECLALWHTAAASKARAALDVAAEARHREAAHQVIDALLAAAPGDPSGLTIQLGQAVSDIDALQLPGRLPAEVVRAKAKAIADLRPRLKEVHTAFMGADASKLSNTAVGRFHGVALRIDRKEGIEMSRAVNERALAAAPDNADLLARRAELTYLGGDLEKTITELQAIIDLPRRPVSLDGMRLFEIRRRAIFAQANAALAVALRATDRAAAKAAIDRAQGYRQKLALEVPENSPDLLFVDGKRQFCEGDLSGAQRTLMEFVRAPGHLGSHLTEARLYLAECASKLTTVGAAREQLQLIHKDSPNSPEVLLALAQIESALQNPAKAVEYYKLVLDIDPDNEQARSELAMLQAVAEGGAKLDDPVLQRLAEAQRIAQGSLNRPGDDRAAVEWLVAGLESSNHDPRLVLGIAQGRASLGDLPGAIAVLEAGLARHAGDERLSGLHKRFKAADTLEGTLALIDESDLSDVNKWLNKRAAYLQRGKTAEAQDALAQAVKLAPEDPIVLDILFSQAFDQKDIAEASRLADIATRTDADRAEGDTFKARLQILQGNDREAANTLRRAVDRGNASPAAHRLLGNVQLKLGSGADALKSFRRALELNPADLTTIKTLLAALVQLGHTAEALSVAQSSEAFGRRDAEFINAWLSLEAAAGNTDFALQRREERLRRDPEDRGNAAALAELYITRRDWARARSLIDSLRAKADSLILVTLDARWHADQGDLEKASQAFVGYISALAASPDPMTPAPYLAFGQFMIQRGQVQTGLNAYRQAVRFQDPKTMPVDALIADTQFTLGMIADAEQAYRKLIAAAVPDPENYLRKRLVDCLIQQQRNADAEREIAALGPAAESDAALLVQRAVAARGLGEPRRARDLLDRAVAKFPDNPLPYFHRARLLAVDPAMAGDAVADLATVIRLQPGHWQALRTRASIALAQGRPGDAIADLRAAVDANPQFESLRFDLIDLLLDQKRESEAIDLADAGIKARATDNAYIVRTADRFSRRGDWARAAKYHKLNWDRLGSPAAAMPYVGALLNLKPPAVAEASTVLASRGLQVEKSIDLLLVRAAVRREAGDSSSATTDALRAFTLIGNLSDLALWHDRLVRAFPEPSAALAVLAAASPPASMTDWFTYFRAATKVRDPAMQSQGLAELQPLTAAEKDKALRLAACQMISGILGEQGKYDEALEAARAGLEAAPEDVILNNNAAYFLTEKLGRPTEALPYTERAVSLSPTHAGIMDTLAATYWALDRKADAIQKLTEALRHVRSATDNVSYSVKLAGWKLQAGDARGAAAVADSVREMLLENPSALTAESKQRWEQLLKDLPAAR